MARKPNVSEVISGVDGELPEVDGVKPVKNKDRRQLGPKVIYIQLAEGTDKAAVLSVHTNTRTLVDSMEQNPGSSYVKHVLPMGEPRGNRNG